jgi:hypothetical protein
MEEVGILVPPFLRSPCRRSPLRRPPTLRSDPLRRAATPSRIRSMAISCERRSPRLRSTSRRSPILRSMPERLSTPGYASTSTRIPAAVTASCRCSIPSSPIASNILESFFHLTYQTTSYMHSINLKISPTGGCPWSGSPGKPLRHLLSTWLPHPLADSRSIPFMKGGYPPFATLARSVHIPYSDAET